MVLNIDINVDFCHTYNVVVKSIFAAGLCDFFRPAFPVCLPFKDRARSDAFPLIVWRINGNSAIAINATQAEENPYMNMYIGNLAYNVTEEDLKGAFAEFGTIESVNIVKDRFSGQSKGFGFVDMPDNSEADRAIKALNGIQIKGRSIKISQSNQKTRGRKKQRRR